MLELLNLIIMYLLILIFVLVSVGVFTLFERKVMGYIHNRKGPNKVGILGLAQFMSDGMKLFLKEYSYTLTSIFNLYFLSPFLMFLLIMLMWSILPMVFNFSNYNLSLLILMILLSLTVYSLIFCGWSSTSKYAVYGAYRGVAQTISYEVSFILILLSLIYFVNSYDIMTLSYFQDNNWFIMSFSILGYIMYICMLAESNRTPFDFTEGESELISGFNIEYGGYYFALLFIGEYASLLLMSVLFVNLFLGGMTIFYVFKVMSILMLNIVIRVTLPRYRYDKLMYLAWKVFLPLSLNYLLFFFSMKFILSSKIK